MKAQLNLRTGASGVSVLVTSCSSGGVAGGAGGTPVIVSYAYDAVGRPVTRGNDSFAYNARGEVVAATLGTNAATYEYDHIGNRETATAQAGTTTYTANALNQYTAIDSWTPSYDADRDGLTALEEALAGTDPARSDTDGDGVSDATERAQGSDPLNATDGGGAPDPATTMALPFRLHGDYAAWAMTVEGVRGDGRTLRLATLAPAGKTALLHILPAAPEFERDAVGVQCRTGRRVRVALTPESFSPDIRLEATLDGTIFAEDSIRLRVAPFIVNPNTDRTDMVFLSDSFPGFILSSLQTLQGVVGGDIEALPASDGFPYAHCASNQIKTRPDDDP